VALVVPNRQALAPGATSEMMFSAIEAQVAAGNSRLARVEQIKKFAVLDDEWRPGVELTPTMKIRRAVIGDKFGHLIDDLYARGREG
jgi:long-chain acyl-CoA synthetase